MSANTAPVGWTRAQSKGTSGVRWSVPVAWGVLALAAVSFGWPAAAESFAMPDMVKLGIEALRWAAVASVVVGGFALLAPQSRVKVEMLLGGVGFAGASAVMLLLN